MRTIALKGQSGTVYVNPDNVFAVISHGGNECRVYGAGEAALVVYESAYTVNQKLTRVDDRYTDVRDM